MFYANCFPLKKSHLSVSNYLYIPAQTVFLIQIVLKLPMVSNNLVTPFSLKETVAISWWITSGDLDRSKIVYKSKMAIIKSHLLWVLICFALRNVLGESSPQWNNWWQYEGISGMTFAFCLSFMSLIVTHYLLGGVSIQFNDNSTNRFLLSVRYDQCDRLKFKTLRIDRVLLSRPATRSQFFTFTHNASNLIQSSSVE